MKKSISLPKPESDSGLLFDPSFLIPPKEAEEIRHTDYYIKHLDKKKGQRKIYQHVEYDEFEKEQIEILRKEIEKQKIQLPADWKISDYLKMGYSGRFDLKACMKAAKDHIEWRNNKQMHTLDNLSRAILTNGMIYLLGRDAQFRPIVYLDCTKINLKKEGEDTILRAICVFLDMIKKYMFKDYFIENWIMVIDTGGLGLTSLPISGLKLIIGSMSTNYCATMEKMFILNPSFMLNTSWSIIKGFIDPESVEKIQFLKPKEYKEMQKRIPVQFIQKKYQGPLDDLTQFWPPKDFFKNENHNGESNKKPALMQKSTDQSTQKQYSTSEMQSSQNKKQQQEEEKQQQQVQFQKQDSIHGNNSNVSNNSKIQHPQDSLIANNSSKIRDSSKPKIIITTVPDGQFDTCYANGGYDEVLEKKLREISRIEKEKEAIIKKQKQKDQENSLKSIQPINIQSNQQAEANKENQVIPSSFSKKQVATTETDTNSKDNEKSITKQNYNQETEQLISGNKHSGVNSQIEEHESDTLIQAPKVTQMKVKSATEDQTNLDQIKELASSRNALIQFEGEDNSQSAKCCENCVIF